MSAAIGSFALAARNNAWANQTFFEALTGAGDAVFAAPRPGFFASLQETMNHIYERDLFYIDALEQGGKGRAVYDRVAVTQAGALFALQQASDARLIVFCDGLTEETLLESRDTERPDGMTSETVQDLLLHLFQHQIHHRGQAHVQLSDAGIAPPQLDDFYLTYGRVPSAAALRGA